MKRIALLLGQDLGYCRDILRGIQAYSLHKLDWVFRDAPPDRRFLAPLREWRPHGIIAHLFNPELVESLKRCQRPVVNTTSTLADCSFPLVEVDHEQVGQMAAQYFIDRGYTNFGYYGSSRAGFSVCREQGFRHIVEQYGGTVYSCHADYLPRPSFETSWRRVDRKVQHWLRKLNKPVAIFCSNDVPARDLAETCVASGFKVPEQVALLGVDNDDAECRLARPQLSSVEIPSEQIGYEAARILDQILSGEPAPTKPIFLPPIRVVSRQSTDTTAVLDHDVRNALAYIRSHYSMHIGVEQVSRGIAVGRRNLERKMSKHLGRTVLQEIQRMRIEAAQQLLAETDLSMASVAVQVGFSNARRMATIFQQQVGTTPSKLRRDMRANFRGRSGV
ncbi:MAG: XylR family transcriptional regulator [Pirellulales bacterium]